MSIIFILTGATIVEALIDSIMRAREKIYNQTHNKRRYQFH